ncbi:transporter [Subtercola sp. Z020]|uniref:DMT family transporter n=1 Tax=Subtercola sp. Z020 TaxID=2080582 RepID=UPI000CE91272|nr:DMT family transporter [Subtercola sp. Z020]PPF89551.1 transporter [Subtercola sp. Z020]
MAPATVAIVLLAAVAHAIWNTVSKYRRGDTIVFVWAYTCLATLLCLPFGLVPLIDGDQPVSVALLVGSLGSAVFHLLYSLTLQTGYDRHDLGVVYPVARGTGPVLTMVVAVVFFGERLGTLPIVGALVVVAGILVVTGNPLRAARPGAAGGLGWGAATGVAIAAYTLWDSYAVSALHLSPVTYFTGTFLAQSLMLAPLALRRRGRLRLDLRRDAIPVTTVAVLSPVSYILVLTALQTAPVALVAPLRESSIVIGSLLAWRLFHEGQLARRLVGAAIVLAGIAAIAL